MLSAALLPQTSIFSPCLHLPIKWTFVHLEWNKIVKNANLAKFILKRMAEMGKFFMRG